MITIKLQGGLGNQLFQIFTLINYSLINNVSYYFENKISNVKNRPYYFNNFLINLNNKIQNYTHKYIYKEKAFHYNKIILQENQTKLEGYFQSYKYFLEKEEEIYKIINLYKQQENIKNKYKYDYDNTISIHFRIGDYKKIQNYHIILSIDYYINSLKKITKRENWTILYFYEHNDENIVKNNINILEKEFPNLIFIPINTKILDYEQLLIMSVCKHNIIANSTFSWWGAYFNNNKDKIIIYPKEWFGPKLKDKYKTKDLFPDKWIKV